MKALSQFVFQHLDFLHLYIFTNMLNFINRNWKFNENMNQKKAKHCFKSYRIPFLFKFELQKRSCFDLDV